MKALAAFVLVPALIGMAAVQSPPADERALVQEFKGLTEPVARTPEALQGEYAKVVRYLLARMTDRRTGSRRQLEARGDLESICLRAGRPGAEAERAALCKAMLPLLEGEAKDAPRGTILKMLEYIGREESAKAVGRLLAGADKKVREQARRALASNPSPEAAAELRQALYRAVDPAWKVALINALGYRRDAASIDWLGKALKDRNEAVTIAAAAALGKIGGAEAIRALNDVRLLALPPLRAEIADALFVCADRAAAGGDRETATVIYRRAYENPTEPTQNRIAALRSMVAVEPGKALPVLLGILSGTDETILPVAVELAKEVPGRAATKAFADLLGAASSPGKKVALIELLGARGDPAGREAVLQALKGRKWRRETREAVRLAVIKALGGVGNKSDVPMLVGLAAQTIKGKEEEQKWARFSLRQLRGEEVNEALIAALGEGDVGVRREAIRALGARGATEAIPDLLGMAGESDATLRRAALEALGQLADEKSLGPLVKWMVEAKESYEALAAERAIINVCARCQDKATAGGILGAAVGGASARTRRSLMRICGRLGGDQALDVLAAGAQDDDENVREAAVAGLSHSRDIRADERLLKLAKTAAKPEHRTLALKGYIRAMRYRDQAPEKKLWLYLQVLDLAQRPEEKKLALDGLGDIKTLAAMKFALENMYSPEVKEAAAYATCRIARYIYTEHHGEVLEAMQRVLRVTENESTAKEAKRIIGLAEAAAKEAASKK